MYSIVSGSGDQLPIRKLYGKVSPESKIEGTPNRNNERSTNQHLACAWVRDTPKQRPRHKYLAL